jgi:NADH:ubiquinone oxidoreductase subunit C
VVPTVSSIWPIAHWQEREVFDLFGVGYDGHPDLRRIFLEDDWLGHPLRKDYHDPDMLESRP